MKPAGTQVKAQPHQYTTQSSNTSVAPLQAQTHHFSPDCVVGHFHFTGQGS
eukprot:m.86738 g.86738  ORF g.86738 m.86738 type:complete len:51 (+) comp21355_c0_seq3:126-278(+)